MKIKEILEISDEDLEKEMTRGFECWTNNQHSFFNKIIKRI